MNKAKVSRRQFLYLSSVTTAGALLAACVAPQTPAGDQAASGSGGAAAMEPVTLDYWFWADSPEQAALTTDTIDKYMEQSDSGITVNTDLISTVADQRQKLLQSYAADAGMPDFSMGSDSWLTEFTEAGMLVDIGERLNGWATYSEWLPAAKRAAHGKPDDPMTMVTNQLLVNYMYYRADWLDEAGLTPPDTLDDVLTVATALNNPPDRFGYGLRGGDGNGFTQQVGHYIKGNGAEIIADDGTVDLDSPAAIEAVDWWLKLFTEHKVTQPSAVTDKFPELFAALQGNKLALMHHGIWSWKIQEEALGDAVSATAIPAGSVRRFVDSFGEGTCIYTTSQKQDAAWEVAAFLGEVDSVRNYSLNRGGAPMLTSLVGSEGYDNRFYRAIMDVSDAWGKYPSWHPNFTPMLSVWGPEVQRALREEITAEELCKTAADFLRNN
ncbi:MAG: substrate-binding domain-containing protein [Caldilineaceae bacterium]